MKISRHGSGRYMGETSIDLKKLAVTWVPSENGVHLKCRNVADFSTEARHNYDIALSVDELRQVLDVALSGLSPPIEKKP